MSSKDNAAQIRLDERQHVEKPLLDQLAELGWEVIDLDAKQQPGDSHRANFTEVVMLPVLREQLKVINPWLEEDQVDEVVKQLTANFPSTNLLQINRHVFNQLLENTSVSENRKTGEKSPSVKFIDFKTGTTTGSSPSASSRSASSAASTTSSRTSCFSSTACRWWWSNASRPR
jgi:type I restriction enzyme, R subunit